MSVLGSVTPRLTARYSTTPLKREGGEAGVWVNKGPKTDSGSKKAR
jgi:hypothetical protein